MSVIIPADLPARIALQSSGFAVENPRDARADITIGIINLMPIKTDTELDFLSIIAPSQLATDVRLIRMASHHSSHTAEDHINRFYTVFEEAMPKLDGVIITGAPLENIAFEQVDYWNELTEIFDRLHSKHIPTLNICWAAYAALYYHYGLRMHLLTKKISGVYPNKISDPQSDIVIGVPDNFYAPFSRFATWKTEELTAIDDIATIAGGDIQGPHILCSLSYPDFYITGHGEYAANTLHKEYIRDLSKGLNPAIPENYYPDDNPDNKPTDRWHETAIRIMDNWLSFVSRIKKETSKNQ